MQLVVVELPGKEAQGTRSHEIQEADDFGALLVAIEPPHILVDRKAQQLQTLRDPSRDQRFDVRVDANAQTPGRNVTKVPYDFFRNDFFEHR